MKITVDAMGDACPIPVIKTKKALDEAGENAEIEVLVDNETALKNVTKMAGSTGAEVTGEKIAEGQYRVLIRSGNAAGQAGGNADGETIVVVSSDKMGEGADELGHILMKSFIFAVTQLETLPAKMVFYNGGAKLTVEGSPALEDLKSLEEQGVEIMTCGTCLDFYGLKDKLAVGSVTNMYSIVETLQGAMSVIRP